jgi:ectoine hydroxylase-related dioxygenase (phytanoyl-CoA dioxygenase family)
MIAELLREGLIEDARGDLPLETRFAEVAGPHAARFGRGWRAAVAQPEVFALHHAPPLVDIVRQLTGSDVVLGHPVFNARPKLPGQQLTVVPWHQDSAYFGPETERSLILTCWIPLVPTDAENGGMQVLPGSHRLGLREHHTEKAEGRFLEAGEGALGEAQDNAVTCVMEPGDVLLLHNLTFHRSLPNVTDGIRWSIDIRYLRDGDHPGGIYWEDPEARWVIRSDTEPVTSPERWTEMTSRFPW